MDFFAAYASQTSCNSANPFALFTIAQSPRETNKAYRTAGAYSYTEFGTLVRAAQSSAESARNSFASVSEKSVCSRASNILRSNRSTRSRMSGCEVGEKLPF
ncbi:hypothetical protein FS749_012836 [Ceratobasidium sp. UAMH 11750]|nr:hypothetical protein FS749_012836 [Ceratobasidium sp. UAMH 11750]